MFLKLRVLLAPELFIYHIIVVNGNRFKIKFLALVVEEKLILVVLSRGLIIFNIRGTPTVSNVTLLKVFNGYLKRKQILNAF